jgi:DNA-binding transcriptional LysR family regulator
MELRHLRSFLVAAELEHFGRAAARLHIVQPALSKQMRELEEEAGVPLFQRLPRGVRLTPAGREFRTHAAEILQRVGEAVAESRAVHAGQKGQLLIGHVDTAVYAPALPRLVDRFRRAHPGIRVELRQHTSLQQAELLRRGEIDVAFVYHVPDRLPALASRMVLDDAVVLAVPTGHRLARRRRVGLAEARAERFVWIPRDLSPAYHAMMIKACRSAGFTPDIVQEGGSDSAILSLVAAGTGLSFALASTRHRRPAGVAFVPLTDAVPRLQLSACWRRDGVNPAVPAFAALLPAAKAARKVSSNR